MDRICSLSEKPMEEIMNEFKVEKLTSGTQRWAVKKILDEWPHEQHVTTCATKKEAVALSLGLAGDLSEIRKWYRLNGERHGWERAAFSAHVFGLKPGHVGANPTTYEPLKEGEQ